MSTQHTNPSFDPDAPKMLKYLSDINNPWKMALYFLFKLPSLFWWRVRVLSCSPYRTEVKLPYGWRSQNPFASIYFAAQIGAAELSTGLMANIAIKDRGRISMLVTDIQAKFIKKANSSTIFTYDEGIKIIEAVQQAIDTGQGVTVTVNSIGVQKTGEVVSEIQVTWSFKVKQR